MTSDMRILRAQLSTFSTTTIGILSASCRRENFQVVDYGVQDEWEGHGQGIRNIKKRVIGRSLAWTELRPLSPRSRRVVAASPMPGAYRPSFSKRRRANPANCVQPVYSGCANGRPTEGSARYARTSRPSAHRLEFYFRKVPIDLSKRCARFLELLAYSWSQTSPAMMSCLKWNTPPMSCHTSKTSWPTCPNIGGSI